MLKTIAFNHFIHTLQALHFEKISQYAKSREEYEHFCIPYRITPEGTELEDWEDARLKAAFLERARRDTVYLLEHKNFTGSLHQQDSVNFEEISTLAQTRNIIEETHQVGDI
jgi:hypothetical protein